MKQLALVAAILSLGAALTAHAANPEAGKEKARTCAACHGPDGNSTAADFPKLAGQHSDYLVKAMRDYKSGARKNAIMAPLVANLTVRDFEDIAAYYSHQQGLVTRKSSYFARDQH